jgi:FkbM family methyltransferase
MIDANEKAITRVKENLELNRININNFYLVAKAVGEKRGKVRFTNYGGASTQNNVIRDEATLDNFVEVEMTTIDDEIRVLNNQPAYIKIDIEGFDFEALKGAVNTLRDGKVKLVKFETNKKEHIRDILVFFKSLSWEVFALDEFGKPSQNKQLIFSNSNLFAAPKLFFDSLK